MVKKTCLQACHVANSHFSKGCGIWFQRIEEIIEHHFEPTTTIPATSKLTLASETQAPHPVLKITKSDVTMKRKQDTIDLDDNMMLFKRVRLLQPKYVNSKKTRPKVSQTQHSSMLKRHRLFAWLEDNMSWEKTQEDNRQRNLPGYLLQTKSFLQLAALNGDKVAVKTLLSKGEDVNAVNAVNVVLTDTHYRKSRCTALHAAVDGSHKAHRRLRIDGRS